MNSLWPQISESNISRRRSKGTNAWGILPKPIPLKHHAYSKYHLLHQTCWSMTHLWPWLLCQNVAVMPKRRKHLLHSNSKEDVRKWTTYIRRHLHQYSLQKYNSGSKKRCRVSKIHLSTNEPVCRQFRIGAVHSIGEDCSHWSLVTLASRIRSRCSR